MGVPYAEVIGDPVAHSKSPLIHNHWLRCLGIPGEYRATQVCRGELSAFLEERRQDPNWRGCNLTIPHKEAAVSKIDSIAEEARAIGAVNCISSKLGELIGQNSDVDGIAAALDAIELKGRSVAVLGGGGAARAAVHYLVRRQVETITVLVRSPERVEQLKGLVPQNALIIGSLSDASFHLEGTAAIINASPMGMKGGPEMPSNLLSAVRTQKRAALFDMVYDPITTPFLLAGGAQRIDGLSMLVGQAARAFELFFGTCPPEPDNELRDRLDGRETRA